MNTPQKILVMQTAFIGDAILATSVVESLHARFPAASLDVLVRKGNEALFAHHPFVRECLIWNKKDGKYRSLLRCLSQIRRKKYDLVINLHRYASSGFLCAFSGARETRGFDKNPLSFLFTKRFPHLIASSEASAIHETERYHWLISDLCGSLPSRPKLYPSEDDYHSVRSWIAEPFITVSPATVWFTKGYPEESWRKFLNQVRGIRVYLLGGPGDAALCDRIASGQSNIINLAGKLSLLQSAALISKARLSYTNDSAPLHLCSAMNAPVAAIFCSTVPVFGFGPLSDDAHILEVENDLPCRPCGIHGHAACPQKHFACSAIETQKLLKVLEAHTHDSHP